MSDTIDTLRGELFSTLRALRDPDKPMEIDRAKAISEVAQTIINSAKVEVDLAKATGKITASDFIPLPRPGGAKPAERPTLSEPYSGTLPALREAPRGRM